MLVNYSPDASRSPNLWLERMLHSLYNWKSRNLGSQCVYSTRILKIFIEKLHLGITEYLHESIKSNTYLMANEQSQSLTRLTIHVCGEQNVLYVRLCDVNVLRRIVYYARLAYTTHSHRSTAYVLVKVRFLRIG